MKTERKQQKLVLSHPVNSNGHVGTLPTFYGSSTQVKDVMTSKMSLKNNHPNNYIKITKSRIQNNPDMALKQMSIYVVKNEFQ